jgi:hypothetical protein
MTWQLYCLQIAFVRTISVNKSQTESLEKCYHDVPKVSVEVADDVEEGSNVAGVTAELFVGRHQHLKLKVTKLHQYPVQRILKGEVSLYQLTSCLTGLD